MADEEEVAMDVDVVIDKYIKVRDKKGEIKKRHTEELKPYNKALEVIETKLLMALNAQNVDSFKTSAGTAFKTVRSSVQIKDFGVALDYIMTNDLTHVLEQRLSKTAVGEFVEANGVNFPGTDINNETIVQVRRK